MTLSREIRDHNFLAFPWHAVFLAFAQNFMDVDTVITAMLIESGGGAVHIGIMATIMMINRKCCFGLFLQECCA